MTAIAASPAAADHDIERRIAQRLARLRAEHGWSLDALAERTGISRATLSRLEGSLTLEVEGSLFRLRAGDCLRYLRAGPTRFRSTGNREARYVVAIVHP